MSNIRKTELRVSKKANDIAIKYLTDIEQLMSSFRDLKTDFLKNGTTVYDCNGLKLGKVEKSEWQINNKNQFNMPTGFQLTYWVQVGTKKEPSLKEYRESQIFDKYKIIELMSKRITKIRVSK